MIKYFKNLFAELAFFKLCRDTMCDVSINPLLEWWSEHDCDPRLFDVIQRMPPSLAVPLADEEVFIAWDIATDVQNRNISRNAVIAGRATSSVWAICSMGFVVLLLIFILFRSVSYFLPGPPRVVEVIFIAAPILTAGVFMPFAGFGDKIALLNYGTSNFVPWIVGMMVFLFSIVGGGILILNRNDIWTDIDQLFLTAQHAVGIIFSSLLVSVAIALVLYCYSIRHIKHLIHLRRTQT